MLSVRYCEPRGTYEYGVHYTGNQERDRKVESGTASTRRSSEGEGNEAGQGTTTKNISRRPEKDCCCSAGTLGEDQSSEEIRLGMTKFRFIARGVTFNLGLLASNPVLGRGRKSELELVTRHSVP